MNLLYSYMTFIVT